jgi:cellulose synthase/poly-beta-1,6-N-acetylglucosamine synthase-like glycosyltransferase
MRSLAGLFVFPLGSGTIYDKNVVLDVGGWGDNIIQDDIWMGAKLALNGYDTHLLGELSLRILVPSTLAAFKTQQKRWAYGTSDVLRRSALKLVKSHKLSFWRRLEMLAYMSLPLLTIPVSISFLLLPIAGALEQRITFGMFLKEILYMSSPFILIFPIYYYFYQRLMKKYSLKQTITNLGRFTAILTTLTPTLAWNSLKGLLGLPLSYEVTPKGKKETQEKKPKDPFYMLLWSTLSLFISVLNQNTIIGALSLAFLAASLWTLARAEKIVA